MKLPACIFFILILSAQAAEAQIDFEKMRKQYEKRIPFLDSISSLPTDFDLEFEEITVAISDSISVSA